MTTSEKLHTAAQRSVREGNGGELRVGGSKARISGKENKGTARRIVVACSHRVSGVVMADAVRTCGTATTSLVSLVASTSLAWWFCSRSQLLS
jgi:hypothetical protein